MFFFAIFATFASKKSKIDFRGAIRRRENYGLRKTAALCYTGFHFKETPTHGPNL